MFKLIDWENKKLERDNKMLNKKIPVNDYMLIIALNGEQKKILFKTTDRAEAFSMFRWERDENLVVFPKKFVNTGGIIPVKYELYLLKSFGSEAIVPEDKIFNENWKLLDKCNFDIEESFNLFGHDKKSERKTIFELVGILLEKKSAIREVIVVNNKVLIYNDETFDMVICKCKKDAQRLHNMLYNLLQKIKGAKFIFLGVANSETTTFLYDVIESETGWNRTRIRRTSTRP